MYLDISYLIHMYIYIYNIVGYNLDMIDRIPFAETRDRGVSVVEGLHSAVGIAVGGHPCGEMLRGEKREACTNWL